MDLETAQSPGSTVAYSEMDDHMTTHASSPSRADPRSSLKHVLDNPDSRTNTPPTSRLNREMTEDEEARTPGGHMQEAPSKPATSRKRKEGGPGGPQLSSATGTKIKHLKKDDGEPLWRRDIQYDFLKAVFDNGEEVFTNSYEPDRPKQNFADLYVDTMARSSKTSKILRDKLLTEHEPAKNMAMVCLLVNLGRMNTTLNCKDIIFCMRSVLTNCSLPRNARAASNLPRHPVPTSTPRSKLLQAAAGCTKTQVNTQGGVRRPTRAGQSRENQDDPGSSNESGQLDIRPCSVCAKGHGTAFPTTT